MSLPTLRAIDHRDSHIVREIGQTSTRKLASQSTIVLVDASRRVSLGIIRQTAPEYPRRGCVDFVIPANLKCTFGGEGGWG